MDALDIKKFQKYSHEKIPIFCLEFSASFVEGLLVQGSNNLYENWVNSTISLLSHTWNA